jgi:hypothetical protein
LSEENTNFNQLFLLNWPIGLSSNPNNLTFQADNGGCILYSCIDVTDFDQKTFEILYEINLLCLKNMGVLKPFKFLKGALANGGQV